MSYVPPHKRNSKDPVQPSPFPDSPLLTKFRRNIDDLKSSYFQGNGIVYSGKYFTKWFLVSSNGIEDEVPPSVNLVPLSSDSSDCINGLKALELMNNDFHKDMITEESEEEERTRWLLVAEKVADDLVFAYEQANKRKEDHEISDNAKLRLVARFGKIVFYGRKAGPVVDYSLKNSRRIFSTDVPASFIQNIKSNAITSHEFCIDGEKEKYIVKITGPNEIISCKCTVKEDGRLIMYKASLGEIVELNPERHLTIDVSCTVKNLDVRLMLAGKRKINTLTENELSNIQGLLSSAIVDLNVKGRLRWPLGTTSSEGGYKIFEVCHVRVTIYKKHTLGLKVRETDGFNERNGTGEIAKGVTLILKEMNTKLQEQNIERGCVLEMLRDALGTIWDFLCCDANLMQ
ncbi:BnaAnng13270D [Brassica napus]|uniref:(rape) hypothetical protein n=1 Tax=Brassica napus TaxID=3708 RepID=A0A078IZ92_BRANA|nr:unnamed protein product [Brassica napus]CDY54462.1 BnaAnng13270D [Brassica napus]